MRLIVDENIPFAEAAFGRFGDVRTMPGRAIVRAALADADVLLVRSVTPVDGALLDATPVRFVGTATAGTDHLDTAYLEAQRIAYASAPGSNAASVADYVVAALLSMGADRGEGLRGQTLGVVGCGAVGSRVAQRAEALGLRVLRCDPLRADQAARRGQAHHFVSLQTILGEADVVTLHTPLTRSEASAHPTYHLIDTGALAAMRPGAWLINTARGAVVDGRALRAALESGRLGGAVLDVWEHEPVPDPELIRLTALATPHIAGYAFDGKVRGTQMVEEALRAWLRSEGHRIPPPWDAEAVLNSQVSLVVETPPPSDAPRPADETRWLDALTRYVYDIRADNHRFREVFLGARPEARGSAFQHLRRTYPVRREFARYRVRGIVPEALRHATTEGLCMSLESDEEGRKEESGLSQV